MWVQTQLYTCIFLRSSYFCLLVYLSVLLHNRFDNSYFLKWQGIRHARIPGGPHCTNTMSIWNSNKQLYVLPCLLRPAFSEFLDQSKLLFLISFLLPSFLFSHSFIIRGPAASCLLQVWWTFLVKSREDYCRNWYRFQEFRNGSGQPRPEQGVS